MSLVKIVLGEIFNLINHDLHPLLVGVVLLPMLESKSDHCCLFIAKCVARYVFKLKMLVSFTNPLASQVRPGTYLVS